MLHVLYSNDEHGWYSEATGWADGPVGFEAATRYEEPLAPAPEGCVWQVDGPAVRLKAWLTGDWEGTKEPNDAAEQLVEGDRLVLLLEEDQDDGQRLATLHASPTAAFASNLAGDADWTAEACVDLTTGKTFEVRQRHLSFEFNVQTPDPQIFTGPTTAGRTSDRDELVLIVAEALAEHMRQGEIGAVGLAEAAVDALPPHILR